MEFMSVAPEPKPAQKVWKTINDLSKVDPNEARVMDLGGENLFDWIIVFPNIILDTDGTRPTIRPLSDPKFKKDPKTLKYQLKILRKLEDAGLLISKAYSSDGEKVYVQVTASLGRLMKEAEDQREKLPLVQEPGMTGLAPEYAEFTVANRSKFQGFHETTRLGTGRIEQFSSAVRQRLILSIIESPTEKGGASLSLPKYISKGAVLAFFPLHDDKVKLWFWDAWVRPGSWLRNQPLDAIRLYFGEKIAFYFLFLGHYIKHLLVPSIFGGILEVIRLARGKSDIIALLVYGSFLSVWGTVVLELWKRESSKYAHLWGVSGFEEEEDIRPEFKMPGADGKSSGFDPFAMLSGSGDGAKSGRSGKSSKLWKYILSFSIINLMIGVVVGTFVAILLFKDEAGSTLAGLSNAVSIAVLNAIYQKVAERLNDYENHLTDTSYENHLILKTFSFQFVNSYSGLMYTAFINRNIDDLRVQLISIFIFKQILTNVVEIAVPIFNMKRRQAKRQLSSVLGNDEGQGNYYSKIDYETELDEYQFDEFSEIVIQYGYVCLFSVVFPAAAFWALVNNIIEIRGDAYQLLKCFRRPEPKRASNIGTWMVCLEAMSTLAVMANVTIIFLLTTDIDDIFPEMSTLERFTVAVVVEHVLLVIKFVCRALIPDVPAWVHLQQVLSKAKLDGEDDEAADVDGVDEEGGHFVINDMYQNYYGSLEFFERPETLPIVPEW